MDKAKGFTNTPGQLECWRCGDWYPESNAKCNNKNCNEPNEDYIPKQRRFTSASTGEGIRGVLSEDNKTGKRDA